MGGRRRLGAGRVEGAKARIRVPAGAGQIGSLPEQMTLRGASSAGADRDPSGAARIAQTEVLRSRPEGGALRLSASARPPLSGALACSAATAFAVVPVVFGSAQGGRVYAFVFACFLAENRFPLFRKHSRRVGCRCSNGGFASGRVRVPAAGGYPKRGRPETVRSVRCARGATRCAPGDRRHLRKKEHIRNWRGGSAQPCVLPRAPTRRRWRRFPSWRSARTHARLLRRRDGGSG